MLFEDSVLQKDKINTVPSKYNLSSKKSWSIAKGSIVPMKSIPSLVLDDGPEVRILELKRYKQEMGPLLYHGLRFFLKEHPYFDELAFSRELFCNKVSKSHNWCVWNILYNSYNLHFSQMCLIFSWLDLSRSNLFQANQK